MAPTAAATALFAEVENRVAAQTLLEISRQRDPAQTSVDSTWFAYQSQDAIARFEVELGLAFDAALTWHVAAGVELTLFYAYLRIRNQPKAEEHWQLVAPMLTAARKKRRVTPVLDDATAAIEPVTPDAGDAPRPDLDPLDTPWDGYAPRLS